MGQKIHWLFSSVSQSQGYFLTDDVSQSESVCFGVETLRNSWADFGCGQDNFFICLSQEVIRVERTGLSCNMSQSLSQIDFNFL